MTISRRWGVVVAVLAVSAMLVASAGADSIGPTTFESPTFTPGDINGQDGWTKTGPYDAAVATVSSFPDALGYGFGAQALRISNAVVSGSFGDQTFSSGLANPAGEAPAQTHFEASFKIGTTQAAPQSGLSIAVSPDNGSGARMSYLRFDDQADGVHVFFDDVTDPGPLGTVATFNETDVATIDRAHSHVIKFSIDFKPGPANDVVMIYIDGVLKATGTTWEDYYRYDPEQAGGGNVLSPVSKLLFRAKGTASDSLGKGFLIDDVTLASSTLVGPPTNKDQCKNDGWKTFNNPSFKNQGDCVSYVTNGGHSHKNGHHGDHGHHGHHGHQGDHGHRGHQGDHGHNGSEGSIVGQSGHGEHGNQGSKHGEGTGK
jgi:hypothetical protein